MTKTCKDCRRDLPLDSFHKNAAASHGRSHVCRACAVARTRRWREADPARAKALNRSEYEKNPDARKAQAKAWALANQERREEIRKRSAERRRVEMRPVRRAQRVKQYHANIEKSRAKSRGYAKKFREMHPDKARAFAIKTHRARRARKLGVCVERIDYEAIIARDGMRCHICKKAIRERSDLHFDHVIPLAAGGPHVPENIACAHRFCNQSKSAKVLTLF